jgi:hypothetical protein
MAETKLSPWIKGVADTLVGARFIGASIIPTRNRLAVILIDTAFETACRAYLKYKAKIKLDQNHSHRENLVKAVKAKLPDIDNSVWDGIDYYYTEIRCDFYHQSAGKTLTDIDLLDYQETVEFVIDRAFGIKIGDLVKAEVEAVKRCNAKPVTETGEAVIPVAEIRDARDKVLVAVARILPSTVDQVNEFFRQQGAGVKLKPDEFTNIVARNSGTKRLYFFNKGLKRWELSALGRFRATQVLKGETDE